MSKRKIIEIDRDLCNGCALCTTACAEGALALDVEKKAVLVHEIYCDGLGACLDVCPTGALKVIERESDDYDAQATVGHVRKIRGAEAASRVHGTGGAHGRAEHSACPGSLARNIRSEPEAAASPSGAVKSGLSQWPIQLQLVSPLAPYFEGSDLLVAADCTAFALGGFHDELLKGKKLIIACPKLDDTEGYVEKLADLIKRNDLRSLTVAIMTVPCCSGLERIVRQAVALSGEPLDVQKVVVGTDGRVVQAP